jgi:acyl-CoA reductase-like NAD-dependent aldehyde dehydrogenase
MAPAVIDRVSSAMRIYHEEIFGPVAAVLRVPTRTRRCRSPTTATWGFPPRSFPPIGRAARVADQLETGMCHINGPTVHDDPSMPFGGMKASGYGRFGGTAPCTNSPSCGGSPTIRTTPAAAWPKARRRRPAQLHLTLREEDP